MLTFGTLCCRQEAGQGAGNGGCLLDYIGSSLDQAEDFQLLVLTAEDLHAAALANKATFGGVDG